MPPAMQNKKKTLRPTGDFGWDKAVPVAIGPNWLRGTRFRVDGVGESVEPAAVRAFARYLDAVEKRRARKMGNRAACAGVRSLQATAFEYVIDAMPWIDEGLEVLSRILIERLWEESILSFHAWKVLSKALRPVERAGVLRYRQNIEVPRGSLQAYLDPLTSNKFDFITALTITVDFSVPEFVKLADMKNLGVLHMVKPRTIMLGCNSALPCDDRKSEVSDILVRAWSRIASEKGAFPVLRILRLWNFDGVTDASLQYISRFPALVLFDMRGCGFYDHKPAAHIASRLGWQICSKDSLSDLDDLCFGKSIDSQQDPSLWRPRKRKSKPFWEGLKVSRIRREEVQNFLSRTPLKTYQDPHTLPDGAEYVSKEDNDWAVLDWRLFCNKGNNRGQDFDNYMAWTRIGELKDDGDLIKAGAPGVEEQAFVGSQLITPVPMASIVLGQNKPANARPVPSRVRGDRGDDDEYVDTSQPEASAELVVALIFIRLTADYPSKFQELVIADALGESPAVKVTGEGERGGKRVSDGSGRIKESKRQRLDELISSFC